MSTNSPKTFEVRDCALATIATGLNSRSLLELRDRLISITPSCIYYHFWGGRLRTSFEYREYHNDFSFWAHHALHDDILAERLELLNPTDYANMEDLRTELIEIINDRLDELENIPCANIDDQFHFIESKIIIFRTPFIVRHPHELIEVLPKISHSSIFYHFIDAARRLPKPVDDFSTWLEENYGEYQGLVKALRKIDPYFISLTDLQKMVVRTMTEYLLAEPKKGL